MNYLPFIALVINAIGSFFIALGKVHNKDAVGAFSHAVGAAFYALCAVPAWGLFLNP